LRERLGSYVHCGETESSFAFGANMSRVFIMSEPGLAIVWSVLFLGLCEPCPAGCFEPEAGDREPSGEVRDVCPKRDFSRHTQVFQHAIAEGHKTLSRKTLKHLFYTGTLAQRKCTRLFQIGTRAYSNLLCASAAAFSTSTTNLESSICTLDRHE